MQKIFGVLQISILTSLLIFYSQNSFATPLEEEIITLDKAIATLSLAIEKAEKNNLPQVKIGDEFKRFEVVRADIEKMESAAAALRTKAMGQAITSLFEIDVLQGDVKQLQEDLTSYVNNSTQMQQVLEIEGHHFLTTPRSELSHDEFDSLTGVNLSRQALDYEIDLLYHKIITLKKAAANDSQRLRLIETVQHLYNVALIQAWMPHFQKYVDADKIRNLGYDSPTAGSQGIASLLAMLRGKSPTDYYIPAIIDDEKIQQRFFVEFEYNDNTDNYDALTRVQDILRNYNPLAKRLNINQNTNDKVTYDNTYQPIIRNGNEEALFYIQIINNKPFQEAQNQADADAAIKKFEATRFDAILPRSIAAIDGVIESKPGVYRIPKTVTCELLFTL